ncbi:uncharacterized protein V6R79_021441 [Siganus canaliculatus]
MQRSGSYAGSCLCTFSKFKITTAVIANDDAQRRLRSSATSETRNDAVQLRHQEPSSPFGVGQNRGLLRSLCTATFHTAPLLVTASLQSRGELLNASIRLTLNEDDVPDEMQMLQRLPGG